MMQFVFGSYNQFLWLKKIDAAENSDVSTDDSVSGERRQTDRHLFRHGISSITEIAFQEYRRTKPHSKNKKARREEREEGKYNS